MKNIRPLQQGERRIFFNRHRGPGGENTVAEAGWPQLGDEVPRRYAFRRLPVTRLSVSTAAENAIAA